MLLKSTAIDKHENSFFNQDASKSEYDIFKQFMSEII